MSRWKRSNLLYRKRSSRRLMRSKFRARTCIENNKNEVLHFCWCMLIPGIYNWKGDNTFLSSTVSYSGSSARQSEKHLSSASWWLYIETNIVDRISWTHPRTSGIAVSSFRSSNKILDSLRAKAYSIYKELIIRSELLPWRNM